MKLLWSLILLGLTSAAPTKQIIQNTIGVSDYGIYVVNVAIGTPKQQFLVQLSTQSNGLIISDKNCGNCNHTFDSSKSSTYKFLSQGSSDGNNYIIGQDIANLGLTPNLLPIPNTIIQQDSWRYSAIFSQDGLLGLGLQSPSQEDDDNYIGNNLPILVNAYNQGVVDRPIYTIHLKKNIQNGDVGVITYGGEDTTNCGSVIAYQPLAKYDKYIIAFSGISYGSYANSSTYTTLVDATSGYIAGPPSVIANMAKIAGAIPPDQSIFYQIACDQKVPTFTFTIGNKQYTVDASQQIGPSKNATSNMCEWKFYEYFEDQPWIFGGPFARTYCNIYDPGNKRLGFALSKGQ